jgi:hypothetical protein
LYQKEEFEHVTELKLPRLREEVTPTYLFLQIFSTDLLDHIVLATNANSKAEKEAERATKEFTFDRNDILKFISCIIEVMGRRIHFLQAFVRGKERHGDGITVSKWEHLHRLLAFDTKVFFDLFNKGLQSIVKVGGEGTMDEMMLPWTAFHELVVTIERKPNERGVRVYVWTFYLTRSGHPIVFMVIPDIRIPFFTGTQVMDNVAANMPPRTVSVVTDAFFGNLEWLQAHSAYNYTSALNFHHNLADFTLLSHKLGYHQNRVFIYKDVVVSLFVDNNLMITASTVFQHQSLASAALTRHYRGINFASTQPRLTLEDTLKLKVLSSDGLRALCKSLGYSASMCLLIIYIYIHILF